jgi:hypothetical protein
MISVKVVYITQQHYMFCGNFKDFTTVHWSVLTINGQYRMIQFFFFVTGQCYVCV